MKKILLSVAAVLLIGLGANAQPWSFGPKAGVSFSTMSNIPSAKARTGVVAGVFAERMVNDWFSIQTELLYSMQGFRLKEEGITGKYNIDYISMPVLTKFYIMGGLNLQLGAQFSYMTGANLKYDGEKDNVDYMVNKYNVGVFTGIAYDFDFGLILEGRYNIGLSDVFVNAENSKIRTGSLQIAAGWRF